MPSYGYSQSLQVSRCFAGIVEHLAYEGRSHLHTQTAPAGKLDFLGVVPVPLHLSVQKGLEAILYRHYLKTGQSFNCYFPRRFTDTGIFRSESIRQFPDIFVSTAFDGVFSPYFLEKHVDKGQFLACQAGPLPSIYTNCGLQDPEGHFSVFAVIPLVFLIDHTRLRGLPVPQRWEDLLNPIYRREIVFGGWRKNAGGPYDEFNSFILVQCYKRYGSEGLKAFAHNVKCLLPNVQIPKIVGSGSDAGGAISILPWFQAQMCPNRRTSSLVWPQDGALAMPMYFLAKKSRVFDLRILVQYLTGLELARYLVENWYPPVHPAVSYRFPAGASLVWPGWDYIRSNSIPEITRMASRIFWQEWQRWNDGCQ